MDHLPYSLIDVFTTTPYQGSPLAVVCNTTDSLNTRQMQVIARQFNLPETTFICPPTSAQATYRLRSFLPTGDEVIVAGHNSLGAWWQIVDSGLVNHTQTQRYHQELGPQVLPVTVGPSTAGERITITIKIDNGRRSSPEFRDLASSDALLTSLAAVLGLDDPNVDSSRNENGEGRRLWSSIPPMVIPSSSFTSSSSMRYLFIPIRDETTLSRIEFASYADALRRELAGTDIGGVYGFTVTGSSSPRTKCLRLEGCFFRSDLQMGDPLATGSVAGTLAAVLWARGIVGAQEEMDILQGLQQGRIGRMRWARAAGPGGGERGGGGRARGEGGGEMLLSGSAVLVAEGNITIPVVN